LSKPGFTRFFKNKRFNRDLQYKQDKRRFFNQGNFSILKILVQTEETPLENYIQTSIHCTPLLKNWGYRPAESRLKKPINCNVKITSIYDAPAPMLRKRGATGGLLY